MNTNSNRNDAENTDSGLSQEGIEFCALHGIVLHGIVLHGIVENGEKQECKFSIIDLNTNSDRNDAENTDTGLSQEGIEICVLHGIVENGNEEEQKCKCSIHVDEDLV